MIKASTVSIFEVILVKNQQFREELYYYRMGNVFRVDGW